MSLAISPLLVGGVSIREAERTARMARSAAKRGDLRLAVSRAVTAAVMAARASCKIRDRRTLLLADGVIQDVRDLIQGIIVKRAAARLRKMA